METLQITWFILIGILFTGYAILDGFDLGAGIITLFTREDNDRRIIINSVGPFWDGNEVWLLTGGGALFAAFPPVYATVFSGFYIAFMLLLFALIFRAVSLEFRNKVETIGWRRFWDYAFGIGSLVPALLYGVAFGNILAGIPVDENGMFAASFPSSFIGLLNPFALLTGVLTTVLFVMHGALFLVLKTDGDHQKRLQNVASKTWFAVLIFYVVASFYAIFQLPVLFTGHFTNALCWIVLLVLLISIIAAFQSNQKRMHLRAFLFSGLMIACMMALSGISLFPRLVPSRINLDYSLTIYNASSSQLTLTTMFIIAIIGMPIVIGYTAYVYWLFRGKTVIDNESY